MMQSGTTELEWFALVTGLAGGLALFLFGMEQMAEALKVVAGNRMRLLLERLTTNRFVGALTGAFVTAVIQSSSVTTVLVVGFISAGLMTMAQSVGIIMGANIGTTITAQIVAFKVTHYALVLIAGGFALFFLGKRERTKHQGAAIMGLGLVFFGMSVMGDAMRPLRSYEPFLAWMIELERPATGILAGTLFTALIQSSSATTGIVIVMASQGFITLNAGIALAFGANIGTCVTALLASIGKPREALRAATVHVLFNVVGVLIWLPFIGLLADVVIWLSPSSADLAGTARLAAETPRQIANAHTLFNVLNTFLFIGFVRHIARLVEWLVPDRPEEEEELVRAKYLDSELFRTPALALDRARLEILHMGDRVREMLMAILPAVFGGEREDLRAIERMDDAVDHLHGKIVKYLGEISKASLTEPQTEEFMGLMEAVNALENIGDIVEINLVTLGLERIEGHLMVSSATQNVITQVHAEVVRSFDVALQAVTQRSEAAANEVIMRKRAINELLSQAAVHEARRLVAEEPNRVAAYKLEIDTLESLKRIFYFCKRMARVAASRVNIEVGV